MDFGVVQVLEDVSLENYEKSEHKINIKSYLSSLRLILESVNKSSKYNNTTVLDKFKNNSQFILDSPSYVKFFIEEYEKECSLTQILNNNVINF